MSDRTSHRHVIGIAFGSAIVAVVPWFLIRDSRMNGLGFAVGAAVIALIAVLVSIAATRAAGTAVFAAGIALLINDALLTAKFATILGFGHLSLADSVGLWPASALLVLVTSGVYLVIVILERRWLVAVAIVLTILVSWPARLSSRFFV